MCSKFIHTSDQSPGSMFASQAITQWFLVCNRVQTERFFLAALNRLFMLVTPRPTGFVRLRARNASVHLPALKDLLDGHSVDLNWLNWVHEVVIPFCGTLRAPSATTRFTPALAVPSLWPVTHVPSCLCHCVSWSRKNVFFWSKRNERCQCSR